MAHLQRDAAGLIVFDDEVREFVRASSRQGQLARILNALNNAEPGTRTNFEKPFHALQEFLRRRGLVVAISDFWEAPENIVKTVQPLRYRGNELVLFHVLDPEEIRPKLRDPVLLEDLESGDAMEVSPDYTTHEYPAKIDAHIEDLKTRARAARDRLFPGGHQPSAGCGVAGVSGDSEGEAVRMQGPGAGGQGPGKRSGAGSQAPRKGRARGQGPVKGILFTGPWSLGSGH